MSTAQPERLALTETQKNFILSQRAPALAAVATSNANSLNAIRLQPSACSASIMSVANAPPGSGKNDVAIAVRALLAR
jgi:hypothetical protein